MATVITNLLAHSEFLYGLITGALLGAIALCALVLLSHRFTRWLDARDAAHRAGESEPVIVVEGTRAAAALRASGRRVLVATTLDERMRRSREEHSKRNSARDLKRLDQFTEAAARIEAINDALSTREAR